MSRIRYAIIGFGGIAENRIAKEGFCADTDRFEPHPLAELVGATDANPDRRSAVEALGLRWYPSAQALLADESVDAVYIATNNRSHAPMAMTAMQAGKHCFVEKPAATTLEEARALVSEARKRKLSLGVDHMMSCNSYNIEAAGLIRAGAVGSVNDICLHMEFLYGSTPEEAATWRCSEPRELGGPIGDVGSHCLYMAEFLLDDTITEVACAYTPATLSIAVENGAFIQFTTRGGLQGSARVAFNQNRGGLLGTLSNLGYEVYGTEGVIRGYATMFQLSGHPDEPVAVRLETERADGVEQVRPPRIQNIYQEVIARHARSISEATPMDGSDALHNLELILACHESAQNGATTVTVTG